MGMPAARITDNHVCPMVTPGTPPVPHVGGPVIGPGVPTVLIGKIPASVVGDSCTCVGPPDTIVMGSMTVMIGGKPAARIGSSTTHGGVIAVGCPTVLIGDVPGMTQLALTPCQILAELATVDDNSPEGAQRKADLQANLDDAVYMNFGNYPPGQQAAITQGLNNYQKTSHDTEMAHLSNAVYGGGEYGCGETPCGYRKLEGEELERVTGTPAGAFVDESSGFSSAVYASTTGKEPKYTAAFAGTEMTSGADWKTNVAQGTGRPTTQYDRALLIGDNLEETQGAGGFQTTGHSLGGGLASAASTSSGASGTTFNAAGLHENTSERYGISPELREERLNRVDAYYDSKDALHAIQSNVAPVLTFPARVATGALEKGARFLDWATFGLTERLTNPVRGLAEQTRRLGPEASGNQIELPAGWTESGFHGMGAVVELMEKKEEAERIHLMNLLGC